MTAAASSGVVAAGLLGRACEDTITLVAEWENYTDGSAGHATYTASWTAAQADVHSQQRFFCLMEGGEVTADQVTRHNSSVVIINTNMFTVGLGQCQVTVYKTYDAIKFQKIFCDIDPSHHCNVYISATAATPWPVTTHKVQTVPIPRLRADTDL